MSNRIDPSLTQFQTKKFVLRSIYFSLGFFLVSALLIYYFYNYLRDIEIADIRQAESADLEHYSSEVLDHFRRALSDGYILSRIPAISDYGDSFDPTQREDIIAFFSIFITRVEIYDRIRLLDLDGNELIHIELVNGGANVIPDEKLMAANACSRFEELQALPNDGYYISNYELASHNCVIDLPHKPIVSAGLPLLNSNGQRYGYLLLDLLAGQEFDVIPDEGGHGDSGHTRQIIITNPDGFYLLNQLDRLSTFGFMLKENADRNFRADFPTEWPMLMQDNGFGQIVSDKGIFSYHTLDLTSGVSFPYQHKSLKVESYHPFYKLISVFTSEHLNDELAPLRATTLNLLIYTLIVSLSIGIGGALALGVVSMNRRALEEQALHDALTGLPNRKFFIQQLENSMMLNHRRSDATTVLFIDLDGFKGINDIYGHKAGDQMLQHISDNIFKALRKTDFLARLGGDEFVVISYDINKGQDATTLAERVLKAIAEPTEFNGDRISLTGSVGIALHTDVSHPEIDILSVADNAMYEAKNRGKNQYWIQLC